MRWWPRNATGGSPTLGKAMDVGDLVNGQFVTVLGWSVAANRLKLALTATGLQKS